MAGFGLDCGMLPHELDSDSWLASSVLLPPALGPVGGGAMGGGGGPVWY